MTFPSHATIAGSRVAACWSVANTATIAEGGGLKIKKKIAA
jgi:hypothetical protein